MVTVTPPLMENTRLAWLPLTASWSAPGPSMSRSSVMLSWPLVRTMVPCSPEMKSIVSAWAGVGVENRLTQRAGAAVGQV
jgi:hypothetical protein